ncbi:TonB-dependent receptor plug domain-containing protein [Thiolapillus sp.]
MNTKVAAGAGLLLVCAGNVLAQENPDFLDMPLEDLLSMEVTSAAKKEQSIKETAASVFVITREDIHRSGVTSIPEALRLAPGVQVSRIDANKWAITTRGFNNQFVNMLLVMIDGRTVYSPTISGVYWDAQDTMLEDIERIEVIRGPGATLWGANAVNGVINIITRNAADTQGGLLVAGAGDEERGYASARYGWQLGKSAAARVYVKYNDRDSFWSPEAGRDAGDQWRGMRGGFRIDSHASVQDSWTFQGDLYRADENQLANYWVDPSDPDSAPYAPYYVDPLVEDEVDSSGWNLLGRWEHVFDSGSMATLQVYYDHTSRSEAFSTQVHDTLDVDFQHRFQPVQGHDLVWGLNYRYIRDDFDNTFMATVMPASQDSSLFSFFVQDEMELLPERLRLVLGSKFEHNEYTGLEIQPTVRLLWLASERTTAWGAVSRAVRTPSRVERSSAIVFQMVPTADPYSPLVVYGYGSDRFDSEKLMAYELGLRHRFMDKLAMDLTLYYHDYDELETLEQQLSPEGIPYLIFDNNLLADSHGAELSLDWEPLEWWRLQLGYSYFSISTTLSADSSFLGAIAPNGLSTPRHQLSLRSLMDLGNDVSLDLWIYHAGEIERAAYLREMPLDAYTGVNLRLAWRPHENLELSLIGRDLLDSRHLEFVGESYLMPTEIERSIHAQVLLHF